MQCGLNHGLLGASKLGVNGRFGVGGPAALARVSVLSYGLGRGMLTLDIKGFDAFERFEVQLFTLFRWRAFW
jgi:hypothetical protein